MLPRQLIWICTNYMNCICINRIVLTVLAFGQLPHSDVVQITAQHFGHDLLDVLADLGPLVHAGSLANLANTLELCKSILSIPHINI